MVECNICKKSFKRITHFHLGTHNLTLGEYLNLYPGASMVSEESRLKYSNGTRRHYETLDKTQRENKYKNRVYSEEGEKKRLENLTYGRSCIDYSDKERNKAIENAKREWWAAKSKEERSAFIKEKVIPHTKLNLGEEEYRASLRERGLKGYKASITKGTSKLLNRFEQEMVDVLTSRGFTCIPQFEIDRWFFDCYIPERNLIVEFDGDYWHPKSLEDCTSSRLKNQWRIDRRKELIATQSGYSIIRIRQSEKQLIYNIV